jgi:hypothetical protein
MIIGTIAPYIASVNAQNQATVNMLTAIGGTSDPAPGSYNYDDGTGVTLTANPDVGNVFLYWIVSDDSGNIFTPLNNPTTLTVVGGTVYSVSPVFVGDQNTGLPGYFGSTTNQSADAIVGILTSAGGTTDPVPGVYNLANATVMTVKAIPDSGWKFLHWVISGGPMTGHSGYPFTATPTENPYTVGHGYGFRYNYQAVFVPVESTQPPPTTGGGGGVSTETVIIIAAVVIVVVILVAIGAVVYSRRSKLKASLLLSALSRLP